MFLSLYYVLLDFKWKLIQFLDSYTEESLSENYHAHIDFNKYNLYG